MEEKLIEIKVTGIKCDNPTCDFYDDTVTWDNVDATIKKWLNQPCPICGEILLTEKDALLVKNITELAATINKLDTAELKRLSDHIDNETFEATLKMDNGKVLIEKKQSDDTKETI
jgi:hypothetical protein